MSTSAIWTTGDEAAPSASGGGGGGGPAGFKVFFSLVGDGTSGTNDGQFYAGIDLSAAGVVQVSNDGGAYANRLGAAPTSIGGGDYYYIPDVTELPAATGSVLVKVIKAGYREVHTEKEVGDPAQLSDLTAAKAEIEAVINGARDTIDDTIAAAITTIDAHTDTKVDAAVATIDANTTSQVSASTATTATNIDSAVTSIDAHTDAEAAAINANTNTQVSAAITTIDADTNAQLAAAVVTIAATVTAAQTSLASAIAEVSDAVQRILGLHGDNSLLDGGAGYAQIQYNSRRLMTAARLRVFANATALAAATPGASDGADGELFRWSMSGTDTGTGLDATFNRSRSL